MVFKVMVKGKLNLIIILFLLSILVVPAYAYVDIENQYNMNAVSISPYICYNNDTFPYHNSYNSSSFFVNSSYVYDNLTDNKTFSETNISSVLCYNTFLGIFSVTSDNQTITDYITNLTAINHSTAVYIYIYKFVNSTNFKDLCIYENGKKEYDYNSYNHINKNYNISTIILSPGKNINFILSFNPKNQTLPTTESGSLYYKLYFNYDDTVYYHYYGIININITTEEYLFAL